ncbi:Ras guanine nucleotide exchange factor bud5 [Friedmanniomyces endolithicus]|nr:Ras guanine nucleotide exchange factor bud5 [Friedmanniomyces endolithicus]
MTANPIGIEAQSTTPGSEHDLEKPRHLPRPSLPMGISTGLAMRVHATPSETPGNPQGTVESEPACAIFHNYLRAFYPFDPATSDVYGEIGVPMTASMKPGDLILVHSIHANAWADGTVVTTAYDHPYLRNPLNAVTQFWDLLGANEEANLSAFVRQDCIRGLIAGVRYLLEHADCLDRGTRLVQRRTGIRRMRKGLLADLSGLVQLAKGLQETISGSYSGEVIHFLLDDLIAKAFKVVTSAVGFVDMWTKETVDTTAGSSQTATRKQPLTPTLESGMLTIDPQATSQLEVPQPVDSAKFFPEFGCQR